MFGVLMVQLALAGPCPGTSFDTSVSPAQPGERERGEVPTVHPQPVFLVRWRGLFRPGMRFVALDGTVVEAERTAIWPWRRRPAALVRPSAPLAAGFWTLEGRDRSKAKREAIKRQGGDPSVGTRTAPARIGERFRVEPGQVSSLSLTAATGTWTTSTTRDLDEDPGRRLRIDTETSGTGPVVWLVYRVGKSKPLVAHLGDEGGVTIGRRTLCSLTPETPEGALEIQGVDAAGRHTARVVVQAGD